jgi:uncharacterized protein (TIGR03437 family)
MNFWERFRSHLQKSRLSSRLFLVAAFAVGLFGQIPVIFPDGAVNAASYLPPTVPGGALPQGGIASLFGADLGPQLGESATAFPLPTEIAGTTVSVILPDGSELPCPLLYVQAAQVNLIIPSAVPIGGHILLVRSLAGTSPPLRIKVVRAAPGLFSIQHFGAYRLAGASLDSPLSPGDRLTIWLTGLGPIAGDDRSLPPIVEPSDDVTVWVGNHRVDRLLYAGRSGCCAGLDQIDLILGDDTPTGCAVPIQVSVGGAMHSNMATIAVAENGASSCLSGSPGSSPSQSIVTEGRVGVHEITDLDLKTVETGIFAIFMTRLTPSFSFSALDFLVARLDSVLLPPVSDQASCVMRSRVVSIQGDFSGFLDAGPSLAFSGVETPVPKVGETYSLTTPAGLSTANTLTVTGPGGTGFPAFEASITPSARWQVDIAGEDRKLSHELTAGTKGTDELLWAGWSSDPFAPLFICRGGSSRGPNSTPQRVLANLPGQSLTVSTVQRSMPAEMQFMTDGPEHGLFLLDRTEIRTLDIGPPRLAATPVTLPDGATIQAELAVTGSEQQRGLMFRSELDADRGMLFWYTSTGTRRFWMFNTPIPLDIIWTDASRRIIFISANTPPCGSANPGQCPTYGPAERSQYVLELAAGEAQRRGLEVGATLEW